MDVEQINISRDFFPFAPVMILANLSLVCFNSELVQIWAETKKQPWLCYITDNLLDLICSILQGYTIQELIWNGMRTFLYLTIEHTFAMMSDEFKYMHTAQLCMVPGQATKSSDHPITTWARYINA